MPRKKRLSTATDYGETETPDHQLEGGDTTFSPRTSTVKRFRKDDEKNGWIKRIELTDFMCHRHVTVNLNGSINFITGNNGSGKSAILTALTVCLGGRASSTQRASSLASLIREGAETATVRVTLNNGAEFNAYRYDRYGDAIVIERRFSRNLGQNRYVTLGAAGRIVSDKREEVYQICDNFSLQVDNPLVVLSQETAKRFLANAKPKELYEFFLKATHLEQLAYDYMFSAERIKMATGRIDSIRETWRGKEAKIKELEGLLREVSRQKDIRRRLNEVKAQLGWSIVGEKEDALKKVANEVGLKEEKLAKTEEQRAKTQVRSHQIQEEIADKQRQVNEVQLELNPVQQAYSDIQSVIRKRKEEKSRLAADMKDLNVNLIQERKNLTRLEKQLQEELSRNNNSRQAKVREEIGLLNATIAELGRHCAEYAQRCEDLKAKRPELNGKIARARERLEEATQSYDTKRRLLDQLKKAKGDKLSQFHEKMPALVQDIERNQGKYARKPIGPIGMYVEIKDRRWELPIEALIGKELDGFIVKNQADHDLLRRTMQGHHVYFPILIVSSDESLNYREGEPDASFTTALRVLNVTHPLVLKALIINSGMEKAVFLPDRIQAKDVLRRRIHNVDSAFTPRERVFVNGTSHSSTSLYRSGKIAFLQDGESRIQDLMRQVKELDDQVRVLHQELKALEDQAADIAKDLSFNDNKQIQIDRQIRAKKTDLQGLEAEIESIASITWATCEEDKIQAEENLRNFENQAKAISREIGAKDKEIGKLEDQLDKNEAEQNTIMERYEEASAELEKASLFRRNADKDLSLADQTKTYLQSELGLLQTKFEQINKEIQEASAELIAKLGPRVELTKSRGDLEKERIRLAALLEELQKSQPDPAQLLEEITGLRDDLAKSKRLIESESQLMAKLQSSLARREKLWHLWRKDIAKLSNVEFILMLQARGFQGKLEYNIEEQQLNIRVKPAAQVMSDKVKQRETLLGGDGENDENSTERDIRQLSGGEKSYSTACFLFSLWTAMSTPLRALDEFDVFMDQVNRDFVIRELVKNARSSRVQFILITPNAIWNSVQLEGDIKVIRLDNPDRNQAVLS